VTNYQFNEGEIMQCITTYATGMHS